MDTKELSLHQIGVVRTWFREKFGIPRQSGLAEAARGEVHFEPPYQNPDCVRGIQEFSHIWILWGFSESSHWSPTVRPPRLGGNTRVGVFASRSPFRPNPIAMSCVRLLAVRYSADQGPVLEIAGADMLDGSPVYDIKPYVPSDEVHGVRFGFAAPQGPVLEVSDPDGHLRKMTEETARAVRELLSLDPRPAYHKDQERIYGMHYKGYNVRFRAVGGIAVVCAVEEDP